MRWGAASAATTALRWVRPLHGIVALLGDAVVPCEVDGIASGAATAGHRFHHPGAVAIGNAGDYAAKLRAAHVIVDQRERQAIVRDRAQALAAGAGLALVSDEGLVAENAGLTEWPVPLLGRFDPAFLAVPREVIQLSMRTNQKYFACTDADGKLAPFFICTANIAAADGGAAIAAGNARVLAARLADARFFRDQDLKVPLATHAAKLGQIVFHEKLGTVADKVARVAKLARWLVEEGIVSPLPLAGGAGGGHPVPGDASRGEREPTPDPSRKREGEDRATLADMAEQAARLCKADLVTGMVGEFPELQGVIGGHYARAEGYPDEVADAIRDHYKPVGQGDDVPTAPVTVAVSLADKLDTLFEFFSQEMMPSGSKDPFALRRSGLAVISLIVRNNLRLSLLESALEAEGNRMSFGSGDDLVVFKANVRAIHAGDDVPDLGLGYVLIWSLMRNIEDFFADRLKVQQREAGVRHDLIDAVFALGGEDDLVRLLARVKALQGFVATEDGGEFARRLPAGGEYRADRGEEGRGDRLRPSP